ncbi:MAG: tRNA glutamyl-Q(34) synthetase GluQRS [Gammaproteobacteria bacterium]|nr:tRNA glutamyl-Q(34) synthetase GluQRS [Gammaproteobacteria bacterium]
MSGARSSSATATTGTAEPARPYRGRFAPSPTGPLHFGSLVAAVASCLEARIRGGEWLVRIEDLDPPRERPGAADSILFALERLGFRWDGPVLRQSTRSAAYRAAIERLRHDGRIRECPCSRAALAALPENRSRAPGDELFHPAACLASVDHSADGVAWRLRVPDRFVEFVDRVQGRQVTNVARTVGDFVLRRRDGLFAYQLAVVVDDADQVITDVVRGTDLLSSTPRQILVQEGLGLPTPTYMHVPLAVDAGGLKLSKSDDAPGLALAEPSMQLVSALEFLGQGPPSELARGTVGDVWEWAVLHWEPARFAGQMTRRTPDHVLRLKAQEDS